MVYIFVKMGNMKKYGAHENGGNLGEIVGPWDELDGICKGGMIHKFESLNR